MTRVVAVDPRAPAAAAVEAAAAVLRADGLVAFPTETFYGLGAAALRPAAVRRIFDVKGRPEGKPLLVLVDSIAMVERLTTDVPPRARALMDRYWPGALTLVLRARADVPFEITAGSGTIGVRLSAHAVARALVTALGGPVTAPSANLSGRPAPTTAAEAVAAFGDALPLVLDGGATQGGRPSTVLDVTVDPPRVIRAGAVQV
ncbi:MAG: threonylcarbamoyl-AMP synthase [Candidatus Rokuibacteriota bacterium]|nr:MAG: threonylcarbamoyl-AMP synthase [Candidatus Rokubacteria bacterium]